MTEINNSLKLVLYSRILERLPEQSDQNRHSILLWLLEKELDCFEQLSVTQKAIALEVIDSRLQILQKRYLNVSTEVAYRRLLSRCSYGIMLPRIRTWVTLSHSRQKLFVKIVQKVLAQILTEDLYLGKQTRAIVKCTQDATLRNALLLTDLEEYCLERIHNHPLLLDYTVDFLRCQTRQEYKELLAILAEETEASGVQQVLENLSCQKRRQKRLLLQEKSVESLAHQEDLAVEWLRLHLQGYSQAAIASQLGLAVEQVQQLQQQVSDRTRQISGSVTPSLGRNNSWGQTLGNF